jgi:hypothetical protein
MRVRPVARTTHVMPVRGSFPPYTRSSGTKQTIHPATPLAAQTPNGMATIDGWGPRPFE